MEATNDIEKTAVFIFGDSHATIFLKAESLKYRADVAGYDGASISGLNELTSRLEYGKHMLNIMFHQPKNCYFLIKLGQVDIEFIIYHKVYNKRENLSFEEFCSMLINKYRTFLISKAFEITKNIIISSINLPAYYDEVDICTYINTVINHETLHEPNKLKIMQDDNNIDPILRDFSLDRIAKNFAYFNGLLRDLAKELNLLYFNTNEVFMDNNTNLLKDQYRDYGHHYRGLYDNEQSDAINVTHKYFEDFFNNSNL